MFMLNDGGWVGGTLGKRIKDSYCRGSRTCRGGALSFWLAHLKASYSIILEEKHIGNFLILSRDRKSFHPTVFYISVLLNILTNI